jgi:RimJ/RimL family protein N-acetyltransferase
MSQELETERLIMRPWVVSDSAVVRLLWAERDPRSRRVIDSHGRPTPDEMRTLITSQLAESRRTGLSLLAIERKGVPGFIGYCGLLVGQASESEPEIAYELLRSVHGNGYATESGHAIVGEARRTGHTRLWATVRQWNKDSFRVLDKLGFIDSGKVTEDLKFGNTVWMTRPIDVSDPPS